MIIVTHDFVHYKWTGIVLLYAANNINDWIPETTKPNIVMLTCVFFVLNLLASTQNIVIDSWALTMLKKWIKQLLFWHYENNSKKHIIDYSEHYF